MRSKSFLIVAFRCLLAHSSSAAMFISEIPVRLRSDKTMRWVTDLSANTTVDDVIQMLVPTSKQRTFALYICFGRQRQRLANTARIYQIVARHGCVRRLCFELRETRTTKRVRFADEVQREETTTLSLEKRLEQLKDNFQRHVQKKQDNYVKSSSILKRYRDPPQRRCAVHLFGLVFRSIPKPICVQTAMIKHLSRSSSESGISSCSSQENLTLETLV